MRRSISLLLVALVVGVLALTGCGSALNPGQTIAKFYETLQQGDLTACYEMMSEFYKEGDGGAGVKGHTQQEFEEAIEELLEHYGELKSFTIDKQEAMGTRSGTVVVTLVWTKDNVDTEETRTVATPGNKGVYKVDGAAIAILAKED